MQSPCGEVRCKDTAFWRLGPSLQNAVPMRMYAAWARHSGVACKNVPLDPFFCALALSHPTHSFAHARTVSIEPRGWIVEALPHTKVDSPGGTHARTATSGRAAVEGFSPMSPTGSDQSSTDM